MVGDLKEGIQKSDEQAASAEAWIEA